MAIGNRNPCACVDIFNLYSRAKFGGGVAGWAIGQLMQLSGFTGSVTETVEAVAMIKNLYIYGVILAWGLIAICMLAYHLDKEYDQVLAELK